MGDVRSFAGQRRTTGDANDERSDVEPGVTCHPPLICSCIPVCALYMVAVGENDPVVKEKSDRDLPRHNGRSRSFDYDNSLRAIVRAT